MIRTTALRTSVSLMCIAALAGCQPTRVSRADCPPAAPTAKPLPRITTSTEHPIAADPKCGKSKDPIEVVHIIVFNIDDPTLEGSTIQHYKSSKDGESSEGKTIKPKTKEDFVVSHVDFDASNYLQTSGFVLIELELQDPDKSTFEPGENAVVTSDAANGAMFCVRRTMNAQQGDKLVRFYVKPLLPPTGQPALRGAYHFHIADKNGVKRLIAIDPEVRNEG